MIIAIVPLLVAIAGLLVFVLASNAKTVEIGKILLWTGTLVTLFSQVSHVVKLG